MFRLVIVDDEDVEREGLIEVIPWKEYGIEIAASAWNGVEGYEKICETRPDIVITDIKMPVMSGIDLIRKVQETLPEVMFVVLTGYGEYEYTSQAMELGIKYYLLKPYEEERLLQVISKVKEEITENRLSRRREKEEYRDKIQSLLPRAKSQFFRSALLTEVVSDHEVRFYREACRIPEQVRVLSVRVEGEQDMLEKFIIQNIAGELLSEERVLFTTVIDREVLFLISGIELEELDAAVKRLKKEFALFSRLPVSAAVSAKGSFEQMHTLNEQIIELYALGRYEKYSGLLSMELFEKNKEMDEFLVEGEKLKEVQTPEQLLMELNILFAKFTIRGCSTEDISRFYTWLLEYLTDEKAVLPFQSGETMDRAAIYARFLETMYEQGRFPERSEEKEDQRMEQVLLNVYANIDRERLSLHWLGTHVLYMNEDYLGRLFTKNRKVKFSSFLLEIRMEMAKRLIQFEPGQRVTDLASLVGYPADGQYFRKMFKKYTGLKPSEYMERVLESQSQK